MDHAIEMEGVEPEGLPVAGIMVMFLAIIGALAVVVVATVQLTEGEYDHAEITALETTGYPLLRETNAAAQSVLSGDAGGVSIEQAMQMVVSERASGATTEITLSR